MAANQQPDHVTIARFRKAKREKINGLFLEVLGLCREARLGKLGKVTVDGTKIAANAALDANRTKDGLEKEVQRILDETDAIDEEEDRKYGRDRRGDELPEEMRRQESRLARLRKVKARLKKEAQEARAKQQEKIAVREKKEEKAGKPLRGRKPFSGQSGERRIQSEHDGSGKPDHENAKGLYLGVQRPTGCGSRSSDSGSESHTGGKRSASVAAADGEMRKNLKATGRENKVKAALGDTGYAN